MGKGCYLLVYFIIIYNYNFSLFYNCNCNIIHTIKIEVSKKIKKPRKQKKKLKKPNSKKKPIRILKKPIGSVQFYKSESKKPNRKKLSQTGKTEPNQFEPVFVLKNRIKPKPVGLNWFRVVIFF